MKVVVTLKFRIYRAELFKKYTIGTWCCDSDAAKKTEKNLVNSPAGLKLYKMLCDISNSQEKIYELMQILKTDIDKEFLINAIEDGKTNINLLCFLAKEYINSKKVA